VCCQRPARVLLSNRQGLCLSPSHRLKPTPNGLHSHRSWRGYRERVQDPLTSSSHGLRHADWATTTSIGMLARTPVDCCSSSQASGSCIECDHCAVIMHKTYAEFALELVRSPQALTVMCCRTLWCCPLQCCGVLWRSMAPQPYPSTLGDPSFTVKTVELHGGRLAEGSMEAAG
jgi:hypothetical protein